MIKSLIKISLILCLSPAGIIFLIFYGFFGPDSAKQLTSEFIEELKGIYLESADMYGSMVTIPSIIIPIILLLLVIMTMCVLFILFITFRRRKKFKKIV